MRQNILFLVAATFFPAVFCTAQFSRDVEQSYLFYNRARILEAAGHLDSSVIYMKKSIRLNAKNDMTREYARKIFMESGHYTEAIEDIKDYYTKNTLPEKADDIFYMCDTATLAKAKKSKEFRQFITSYEDLIRINRQMVKVDNELKQILNDCMVTDQFVRYYSDHTGTTKSDTAFASRLIYYADSTNMASVAAYFKEKGFPSSVELDAVTMTSNFVLSLQHYLQNPAEYSKYPSWKYLDSAMLQAVYSGIFPVRHYVHILDRRNFGKAKTREDVRQLFGTWTNRTVDPVTKKKIRVYDEIEDIAHVDERRRKWLQPTLYEESLIDPEIRLPEGYHPN